MHLRPSKLGAEEMVQGSLAEDTTQWLTNIFNFSSKGPEDLFWLSQAQACKWYTDTHTCRKNIHLHEIKLN